MNLVCLLTFHHRYKSIGASCGFERWRCERCGKIRALVLPALVDQVPKRLDLEPNPKYWNAGPGVSAVDQVGVGNLWLQRGYANEETAPPPTTGNRSN
jgi:hypothetical protein